MSNKKELKPLNIATAGIPTRTITAHARIGSECSNLLSHMQSNKGHSNGSDVIPQVFMHADSSHLIDSQYSVEVETKEYTGVYMDVVETLSFIDKGLDWLKNSGALNTTVVDGMTFHSLLDYEVNSPLTVEEFVKDIYNIVGDTDTGNYNNRVYYYPGYISGRATSARDAKAPLAGMMAGLKSYNALGLNSKYFYGTFKHTLEYDLHGTDGCEEDRVVFDKAVRGLVIDDTNIHNEYIGYGYDEQLKPVDMAYHCIAEELHCDQIDELVYMLKKDK